MKNLNFQKLALEFETTSISLTKMALREGTTRQTLAKYFKKMGVKIINKQNRCKFNCNIFDCIDTEEKAYWLGFIFADGYIGSTPLRNNKKSVYNFEISLKLSDTSHLEKFKKFISYEKPVVTDDHRCRIMIANKHFWETLNNYGCTPRKSLTLKFPKLEIFKSKDLIRHFIRGYFDGDGCFSRHININTVSPSIEVIGTDDFLNKIVLLSNIPAIKSHDKRWSAETEYIRYRLNQGVEFINYIYKNSNIYLDRKYKLYKFFENGSRSVEEFTELLEGKIGEIPKMENTEVSSEITQGSETPQSIGSE